MKKTLIPLLLIITIIITVVAATGCEAASMDKITGTYELTVKTRQHVDESTATDLMEKYEIKCYLVIDGSQKGYYIYQDKDSALTCTEMKVEYTYDSDDTSKVSSVRIYTDPLSSSSDSYYVNYNKSDKTNHLMYRIPGIHSSLAPSLEYTRVADFTQISSDTTLATVKSKLGVDIKVLPTELRYINGLQTMYTENDNSPYIYRYYDIDVLGGTAKLYYALKADGVKHEETKTVAYDLTVTDDSRGTVTIGEEVFSLLNDYYATYTDGELTYNLSSFYAEDLQQQIDEDIALYYESLEETPEAEAEAYKA